MIEEFAVPQWVHLLIRMTGRHYRRSTGGRRRLPVDVAPAGAAELVGAAAVPPHLGSAAEVEALGETPAAIAPEAGAVLPPVPVDPPVAVSVPAEDRITADFVAAARALGARVRGLVVVPDSEGTETAPFGLAQTDARPAVLGREVAAGSVAAPSADIAAPSSADVAAEVPAEAVAEASVVPATFEPAASEAAATAPDPIVGVADDSVEVAPAAADVQVSAEIPPEADGGTTLAVAAEPTGAADAVSTVVVPAAGALVNVAVPSVAVATLASASYDPPDVSGAVAGPVDAVVSEPAPAQAVATVEAAAVADVGLAGDSLPAAVAL
ncbi:MAG TPA: hypothetical protein VF796_23620, partial [Humisphaera sp.]